MARRAEMFPESIVFDLNATLSEADKEARSRRAARHADDFRLRWLIEHNGEPIGWQWGYEAGFLITGMELSDKYGTLVALTKYLHKPREAVTRYRSGETRLPDSLVSYVMH